MKIFALLVALLLASACDAPDSKIKSKPKPPVDTTKSTKSKIPALDPRLAEVHKALRANKKIVAIKEHRKVYRLPLHASKQAVEIEKTKLGLPSVDMVYRLFWNGKKEEAKAHLRLVFKSLNEVSASGKLNQMTKRIGPPTEENMNVHIQKGKLLEALMIYHHLHPGVTMPEMYKIVSAKMPKNPKY